MIPVFPSLLYGHVAHRRLLPKTNAFRYGVYYLALPLDGLEDGSLDTLIACNRWAPQSFYTHDHGTRDGSSLRGWLHNALDACALPHPHRVTLLCMPRVLGYVFNPVSFWLCVSKHGALEAVVCEVNNTFGETHSYVCANPDQRAIGAQDWIEAEKVFHVSPFLEREGSYRFRFAITKDACTIEIHYRNGCHQPVLLTSLTGTFTPLTPQARTRALFQYPLVTLKAMALIHVQALKLWSKKIRYVPKPRPHDVKITCSASDKKISDSLTKV